jgi:hypothetical protein
MKLMKRFLTKYLNLLLSATENPPPIPRQRGIIFEMELRHSLNAKSLNYLPLCLFDEKEVRRRYFRS